MPGLQDIAVVKDTVHSVEVNGLTAHDIAKLIGRFPELGNLISGGSGNITGAQLVAAVPDAIVAIIAAGVGKTGDTETEEMASRLLLGVQVDFLDKIIELTIPAASGPFVDRLGAMFGRIIKTDS